MTALSGGDTSVEIPALDLRDEIGEMAQTATESTATAIDSIGKTISRMNEIATGIAAAVEEQGAATLEITRNTQEAASGTSWSPQT